MHDAFEHLCEDLGKIYTENDAFFDQIMIPVVSVGLMRMS